jgi:hypothetical protein
VRVADGHGGNWTKGFVVADDYENADVLTFWEAQDRARALARGSVNDGRPCTVTATDLKARGGHPANAARIRYHLPPTLASKTVPLLTSRELQRLRDSLATKIKPASVDRLFKGSRRRSILRPRTTQAWGKLSAAIAGT